MKHDLCLRSPDEATAIAQLTSLRGTEQERIGYRKGDGDIVPTPPILREWEDEEDGHCVQYDESYEPVYETREFWTQASHTHALDPIGALGADTAWHANLQTDDDALADSLSAYVITPADRKRVWA